jgi:ABC-type lipoprotein export system ATPase subunit
MPFPLTIPKPDGTSLNHSVDSGQILFVLGANGVGKSALMQRFYSAHRDHARRISAHRQTWFESNAIAMTAIDRRNTEQNMRNQDNNPASRWLDPYAPQRASMAIYDLIDSQNVRARSISDAVDADNLELAKRLARKEAPIRSLNELLRLSNLPIEISVREQEQIFASKSGSTPYSIAELSDGERNALLIGANVLTVKPGTLILIDEPERHLHRSIISPLLTLLFRQRPDCAFIISTHELMLPVDNPLASTLLLRDCVFQDRNIVCWNADLLPAGTTVDDDLKVDILGARQKLLFIEGNERSLDRPLYSLVFPNVSLVAKQGARDILHAVSGIRACAELHWLHAFAIIDNDGRTQAEIDALKTRGVYALPVFCVESIYYHPGIQDRVARRHATITGEQAAERLAAAKTAALSAIRPHLQRLSERAVERTLREQIFQQMPGRDQIAAGAPINVTLDVPAVVAAERARLQTALDAGDLTAIVSRYSVRETPALVQIATNLGFQDRAQYEGAVCKLLMDDSAALAFVKTLFGTLPADIDI